MNRHVLLTVTSTLFSLVGAVVMPALGQEVDGIRVPAGFQVTKFAGDDLATNIFSMALDPSGRVVVSGPGYVKTLIDQNDDGRADFAEEFLKLKGGAQGMHFEKQGDAVILYYVSEGGLWSVANGPLNKPRRILQIKTGGEHDSHSIQRGPDGLLYLLCGNGVPIKTEYYNDPDTPVKEPQAGFLMRLGVEGQPNSIIAHGFRNAYDFAFNQQGQIFTFDSDGERDISLPWYRPTRVFQLMPGDHAGFVSTSWKRPSDYFDMPKEIGALGRGSPTGVVCYSGGQFPHPFYNAILVADWTFGRIVCFQYDPEKKSYDRGHDFASADAQFGFAVTDMVVRPQGDLLVSVGGRGTEGGIYSIRYVGPPALPDRPKHVEVQNNIMASGPNPQATLTELLTRLIHDGDGEALDISFLAGRSDFESVSPELFERFIERLTARLKSPELSEMGGLWKVLKTIPEEHRAALEQQSLHPVSECLVRVAQSKGSNQAIVERAMFCMETLKEVPPAWRGVLIRCVQLALGGAGNPEGPAVFHGYQANQAVQLDAQQAEFFSKGIVDLLPQCFLAERKELARLAAMLPLHSRALIEILTQQISQESTAVDDIHWLICAAKIENPGSELTQQTIANTIVQLFGKLQLEGAQMDRNWAPRMRSLAKALFEKEAVANWVIHHVDFGGPQHVYLYPVFPDSLKPLAASRFLEAVQQSAENISSEQLMIAASVEPAHSKTLLRQFAGRPGLFDRVVQRLSQQPELVDRELFSRGLLSADVETVKWSAKAMRELDLRATPEEQIKALKSACRLGWDRKDSSVRDELIAFLRQSFGDLFDERLSVWKDAYKTGSVARQDGSLEWYRKKLASKYPVEFGRLMNTYATADLSSRLQGIDWETGNATRGEIVFEELQCAKCHDQGNRLGPPLEGVTQRFSRRDLFRSIVSPDEQVPHRYRALIVETIDGRVFKGTVIYESVDGITLLTGSGETVRINRQDIEQRRPSAKSLMPAGLLDTADDGQWSDLFAYLSTL